MQPDSMLWKKSLPMWLTWSRIVLTLPTLLLLWPDEVLLNWLGIFVYFLAAWTDYWDGYFARKFSALSNEGKLLDPVADKVLVSSLLVLLVAQQKADAWMVVMILSRDLIVGGVRSVAAADGVVMAAQNSGKWKTALQMLALPLAINGQGFHDWLGWDSHPFGYWLLWVGAALSGISGFQYFWQYRQARGPKPRT